MINKDNIFSQDINLAKVLEPTLQNQNLDDHDIISIYLMIEKKKGKASTLGTYINELPKNIINGITFNEEA